MTLNFHHIRHATEEQREAFQQAIDNEDYSAKIIGILWNCTDILPSEYCEALGIQQGSSYASGCRKARKLQRIETLHEEWEEQAKEVL